MVRVFRETDLDRVAEIWLAVNITAHHFIDSQYWREHYEAVREMLPQAELYVWEEKETVQGFVGLEGDYIAGIFVSGEAQSGGIGKKLLDYCKGRKPGLCLHVYRKNARAVRFYQREGFEIRDERTDADTGETEYVMRWDA